MHRLSACNPIFELTFEVLVVPVVDMTMRVCPPTYEALLMPANHVLIQLALAVKAFFAKAAFWVPSECTSSQGTLFISLLHVAVQC
jgi:hypothetical protein